MVLPAPASLINLGAMASSAAELLAGFMHPRGGLCRVEKQGTCMACTSSSSTNEGCACSSCARLLHHAQPILFHRKRKMNDFQVDVAVASICSKIDQRAKRFKIRMQDPQPAPFLIRTLQARREREREDMGFFCEYKEG